jgi:dsRNA-specific ribonuclease
MEHNFSMFIVKFLRRSPFLSSSKSNINKYLTTRCQDIFKLAFVHRSIDETQNYEHFQRIPFLQDPRGVKIMTRLKINLISKHFFAKMAEQLNFAQFIRIAPSAEGSPSLITHSILEDVFEAIFGVITQIGDEEFGLYTGNRISFEILKTLLDEINIISMLDYKTLFDSKTIIKELIDYYRGKLVVEDIEVKEDKMYKVTKILLPSKQIIGQGMGYKKCNAQQQCCENAIRVLKKMGYEKPLSDYYLQLQKYIANNK